MREVSIIGIGRTEFVSRADWRSSAGYLMVSGVPFTDLGKEAVLKAFEDSKNLEKKDVEIVYCGRSDPVSNAGQMILDSLDMLSEGSYSVENGSASGTTALMSACNDVAAGVHDLALVIGCETMPPGNLYIHRAGQSWRCRDSKAAPYARLFAQLARRHAKEYGTTKEQLAMVAAKNRKNGALNPNALLKEEVTVEEVLNSKVVDEPLTEYMCAPSASGAVALILAPSKVASYYNDSPIRIAGYAMTSAKPGLEYLESAYEPIVRAAREAYRRVSPFFCARDADIAQVHDSFTITELIGYEALGFCERGKSGKWVEDGIPMLEGDLPVNTDGGMIANGQPLGACGLAQVYELVLQLRGKAERRQVKDAEWAIQYNGGSEGSSFCGGFGGRGFGTGGAYFVGIFTST